MDLKEVINEIIFMGPDAGDETIGRIMRKADKGILEEYGGIIQDLYNAIEQLNELKFRVEQYQEMKKDLADLKNDDVDFILDNYY